MQRYFLSFFVFLGIAWMVGCAREDASPTVSVQPEKSIEEVEEEEILQVQQENPHLALYKDSVYSTLYHADLGGLLLAANTSIQWEVQGGRYHIYEEELSFFKELRPLQRTILFLEKTKYDVFVTLHKRGEVQETNHIELDLSGLSNSFLKTDLEINKLSPLPGEAMKIHAKIDSSESLSSQWEIKRLRKVKCPSLEDILPEAMQTELSSISEICDRSYEEALVEGKDYLLEQEASSVEGEIIFKHPGTYAIYFYGYDTHGQLLSKSFRRIILEGTIVSHR